MRIMVVVAALVAALPFSARAQSQTVQQVFRSFGLIGVWARACDQPASLDDANSHVIYALSGTDGVMLTYDNGPKYKPSFYTVLSAARMGANRLTYVEQLLNSSQRATVIVQKFGKEIGVVSSVMEDGKVLVENGKMNATGTMKSAPEPVPRLSGGPRKPPGSRSPRRSPEAGTNELVPFPGRQFWSKQPSARGVSPPGKQGRADGAPFFCAYHSGLAPRAGP